MFVKLIQCHVPPERREIFSQGQAAWRELFDCAGFLGQLGGWSTGDEGLAVIVGLWSGRDSYDAFMRDGHDEIFERGGQRRAYESIDIALWHLVLAIPGQASTLSDGVRSAGAIRLARCRVRRDRQDHFIEAQRRIWNSGMAACDGMLAGVFGAHTERNDEFLVCTLWNTVAAHARYQAEQSPALAAHAVAERDCSSITGWFLPVDPTWRAVPTA